MHLLFSSIGLKEWVKKKHDNNRNNIYRELHLYGTRIHTTTKKQAEVEEWKKREREYVVEKK